MSSSVRDFGDLAVNKIDLVSAIKEVTFYLGRTRQSTNKYII